MPSCRMVALCAAAAASGLLASSTPAAAQEEREPGWYDQAELSVVLTAGNTESQTIGAKNRLERLFPRSSLVFDVGGIRIRTGTGERTAIGSPDDFEIRKDSETETTAENYFATLRFDREISDRGYAYASSGWVRNRFAGIDDRFTGAAGVGWKLLESERTRYRVDLAGTATREEPVIGEAETFAGLRLTWDLAHRLTETARVASLLVVDENLAETEDLRAEFDNSIAVDISDALALKTGVKFLFDNQPALEEIDLVASPGGTPIGTVLAPLRELDTQITAALIVTLD